MIPTYQIWRKAILKYNETEDVYVGFRRSRKEAEDWIATQKNQSLPPDIYYIKEMK